MPFSPIHTLLDGVTADGAGSVVYPPYGQYVLAQFSKSGTFTTGDVTVEGRVSSDHDWVVVGSFDQNTEAADMAAIVARFPEMRGQVDNLTGAGATVDLAIVETDQPRP